MTDGRSTQDLLLGFALGLFLAAVAIVFVVVFVTEQNARIQRWMLAAWEGERKHLEEILDRFLSRSFEELQAGRMIASEVVADQAEQEDVEDKAVREYEELQREAAARAAGGE